MGVVDELAKYMVYCCAALGNREATIVGKIVAVDLFHGPWTGRSSPLNHFRIKAVKEGIKRVDVEWGTQQRVRRPLLWKRDRQGVGIRRESIVDRAGVVSRSRRCSSKTAVEYTLCID